MAYTTISKSTDYFNPVSYTGNGASDRAITSGFATDFVWIKNRNTTDDHVIFDKVRGGTKYVYTNSTQAESTYSSLDLTFENTGVDVGSYTTINNNGSGIISYHWLANGAGSANTAGSINSTATSANTTAGFSIVKYTGNQTAGATVGHGLGSVPKMIIVKNLNDSENWVVYHNKLGNTDGLYLNTNDSTVGTNTFWNNTTPTTTLFTLGTHDRVNNVNIPYIAYCFAEKTGYSKFGKYIGNGNADGTFIYTGFKPAFIMLKNSSSSGTNWFMHDAARNPSNPIGYYLTADNNTADQTTDLLDITSNGFKQRNSYANLNGSGDTYIYMAFAEAPLVGTNGVTAKAR